MLPNIPNARYKTFSITGVVSVETKEAEGIQFNEEGARFLHGLIVFVNKREGNTVKLVNGQTEIGGVFDHSIDTDESTGATNILNQGQKLNYIPFNQPVQEGDVFKAALLCGATASDLYGSYVYSTEAP